MKLLSTLIIQNTTKKEEIKSVIIMMKSDIKKDYGPALQEEVSIVLVNLSGMAEIIEAYISQIKDNIESQKNDIIKAITKEKEDSIKAIKKKKKDSIKALTQEKKKEISEL
jgi:protein involved in polysaccharide export with SLBB domain